MKRHIPNFITSLNLATGIIGIYYVLIVGRPEAIYFVILGAFFDLLKDDFDCRFQKAFGDSPEVIAQGFDVCLYRDSPSRSFNS